MDILKTATDWAKAEMFSTSFFILAGLLFVTASIGFWQLGKTELAKAYVVPLLVAGLLLITIGLGLFFTNKFRVKQFELAYHNNATAFVDAELERADRTLKEYDTVVFTVVPLLIAACAFGLIFVSTPFGRAGLITTIAMLVIILLIDGTAYARINIYNQKLIEARG